MNFIILGPPGSGKGTLAKRICKRYHIDHISTGDLFRFNIKKKTELGKLAVSYIDRGDLVPDDVTVGMVQQRLSELAPDEGFLLDGFPRTTEQADALAEILTNLDRQLDAAINVCLEDDVIVGRLKGRRVCRNCGASFNLDTMPPKVFDVCDECGGELYHREDDKPETISNRLAVYRENTSPLIKYYEDRDILVSIDNAGAPEETEAALFVLLDQVTQRAKNRK
ncbi:MAG: adenylate kinase [Fastidiosipilaceae bacterium]|nr:adenylate kinase [Clostridiaceae bacterium]